MLLLKKIFFIILVQQVALMYCDIKAQTRGSEIAYLQTDRTVYIAGESIYYKLYILDAATKKRSVQSSKVGYVVLRAVNSTPSLKIRVNVNEGMANGSIVLPDTLTSGVYQVIAFTSAMRNPGEESFFHKEITIANRFDKALDFKLLESGTKNSNLTRLQSLEPLIKTDKPVYGTREKVIVHLAKTNCKANVSVSVFEESKIPSTYKSIVETVNDSSVVQKSKRVSNYHSPESKGKILRGTVVDVKTKQTIKDAVVLLSCVDTIPNLQYAVANSNGLFQMLLSDYYDGKELFLTIKDAPENSTWKIMIEDEFAQSEKWNPSLNYDNENYREFIVKSQNIVYINKSYKLNEDANEKQLIDVKSVCPQFYHSPVVTVLPSDFVPLPDFLEIAVEILPQVRIIKEKGKYCVQIFNDLLRQYDRRSPAIFLDGVFLDDVDKIILLGSEQIKKIDVIAAERAFGDLVFSGVVSITSKTNEMINTKPASYSMRLKNDNVNTGGNLVAVNPNTLHNPNIPFLKQLLYWNPNMELNGTDDTKFEFYTSDNLANYSIKVEGISEDGTPISASSGIQVTNKINSTDK